MNSNYGKIVGLLMIIIISIVYFLYKKKTVDNTEIDADFSAVSPAQLAAYTPAQIAALTPAQIETFTPAQLAALTPAQQNVMTTDSKAAVVGAKISDADMDYAFSLAKRISDDCSGWGSHNMGMYLELMALNDTLFTYLILTAWPTYRKGSLGDQLKKENFNVLDKWSKNRDWNGDKAIAYISTIHARLNRLKL